MLLHRECGRSASGERLDSKREAISFDSILEIERLGRVLSNEDPLPSAGHGSGGAAGCNTQNSTGKADE